jgi:hypothetical protein
VGPVSRVIFAVPQLSAFEQKQCVGRIVVTRLMVPTEAVPAIIAATRPMTEVTSMPEIIRQQGTALRATSSRNARASSESTTSH